MKVPDTGSQQKQINRLTTQNVVNTITPPNPGPLNWRAVWDSRTFIRQPFPNDNIISLLRMDGFDSGISTIEMSDWLYYVLSVRKKLNMTKSDRIFEVGCGSGAFLYPLYKLGHVVGGIDYSDEMITVARKHLRNGIFESREAADLVIDPQYDFVISNSVFSYFGNYNYAGKVIDLMFQKAKKAIVILDVPNLKFRKKSEQTRSRQIKNYKQLYAGIKHLYYEKKWFLDFAEENNCDIILFDQDIKNYGNSGFRFNCILQKRP